MATPTPVDNGDDTALTSWSMSPWRSFIRHRGPADPIDCAEQASSPKGRIVLTALFAKDVASNPVNPDDPQDIFAQALKETRDRKSFASAASLSRMRKSCNSSSTRILVEENRRRENANRSFADWSTDVDNDRRQTEEDDGDTDDEDEETYAEESYAPLVKGAAAFAYSPTKGPVTPEGSSPPPVPPSPSCYSPTPPPPQQHRRPPSRAAALAASPTGSRTPGSVHSCPNLELPSGTHPSAPCSPNSIGSGGSFTTSGGASPSASTPAADWSACSPHAMPARAPSRLGLHATVSGESSSRSPAPGSSFTGGCSPGGSMMAMRSPMSMTEGGSTVEMVMVNEVMVPMRRGAMRCNTPAGTRPGSTGIVGGRLLHSQAAHAPTRRSFDLPGPRAPMTPSGAPPPSRGTVSFDAGPGGAGFPLRSGGGTNSGMVDAAACCSPTASGDIASPSAATARMSGRGTSFSDANFSAGCAGSFQGGARPGSVLDHCNAPAPGSAVPEPRALRPTSSLRSGRSFTAAARPDVISQAMLPPGPRPMPPAMPQPGTFPTRSENSVSRGSARRPVGTAGEGGAAVEPGTGVARAPPSPTAPSSPMRGAGYSSGIMDRLKGMFL